MVEIIRTRLLRIDRVARAMLVVSVLLWIFLAANVWVGFADYGISQAQPVVGTLTLILFVAVYALSVYELSLLTKLRDTDPGPVPLRYWLIEARLVAILVLFLAMVFAPLQTRVYCPLAELGISPKTKERYAMGRSMAGSSVFSQQEPTRCFRIQRAGMTEEGDETVDLTDATLAASIFATGAPNDTLSRRMADVDPAPDGDAEITAARILHLAAGLE